MVQTQTTYIIAVCSLHMAWQSTLAFWPITIFKTDDSRMIWFMIEPMTEPSSEQCLPASS
jgi:hypothetical protein